MEHGLKTINWVAILSIFFLSSCSGIPMRLKSTADQSMNFLMAEMATHELFLQPVKTEQYQIAEEQWCLIYQFGSNFYFSSMWEKQDYDWVRTELRSYVANCNWAR